MISENVDLPYLPAKGTIYLRARIADVDNRYCVLCRYPARVFVDVKRGRVWWWEAFPLCEDCAKQLPRALSKLDLSS